jgi:hypothetical protein
VPAGAGDVFQEAAEVDIIILYKNEYCCNITKTIG